MTEFRTFKAPGVLVKGKREAGVATFKLVNNRGATVANLKVLDDKIPDLVAWLTDVLSDD